MRALTVIEPFATLIATGVKRVENRTWPTAYRGPLAIHAGKARRYGGERVEDLAAGFGIDPALLTFGAVVAVAELIDCVRLDGPTVPRSVAIRHPWLQEHSHAEGPECWVLANVRRLSVPIVVNGARGLWDWTPPGPLAFGEPQRGTAARVPEGQPDLFGGGPAAAGVAVA